MTARRAQLGAYERALAFSKARRLFPPGARVLVGSCSGAASLGALGFVLLAQRALGIAEIAVGAVDLGSEDDAEAVADTGRFARQLGVTFYAVSADGRPPVAALAALARREGFGPIVLGTTRDDAVAHVLAAVVGGHGLEGLRPLRARSVTGVVRPLLDLREAEALELARTAGIEPVSLPPDETARPPLEARLRATILPRLRVEARGADAALLAVAREVRQLRQLVRDEARARVGAARTTGAGLEVPVVGSNRALAVAVAREVCVRLEVPAGVARGARAALAQLLRTPRREARTREVVLGPGLIAAYLPPTGVVAVRVMRQRRLREEGVSG